MPLASDVGATFAAITGTEDGTTVEVKLTNAAGLLTGGPVTDTSKTFSFTLGRGDVAELASQAFGDLSGSLIRADKPVQVIAGTACGSLAPASIANATCDHLEESLLPAETLGKHYFLAAPTGALGLPASYGARIYGNVAGTNLSYPSGAPPGAPSSVGAAQVVDLGFLNGDFEIVADHEIAVATFLTSSALANPDDLYGRGDPSQSQVVAVEQYRKSYVFLAPNDYDTSFVDVIAPLAAQTTLDGEPIPGTPSPLGGSGFGVTRVRLGAGDGGAHSLVSDVPVGVQVMGYGAYTSYQYPAGMNLQTIAPPPPL